MILMIIVMVRIILPFFPQEISYHISVNINMIRFYTDDSYFCTDKDT